MKINIPIKLAFIGITMITHTTGCIAFTNTLPNAVVSVYVVDNEKIPIKGVLSDYSSPTDYSSNAGLTDTNGIYSVKLYNIWAYISGSFSKQDYYKTSGQLWKWSPCDECKNVSRWCDHNPPPPSTPFTIIMKRINNPVPMKYKNVQIVFPRLNEPVGFDFEVGDWVFPDGKGIIADIFITTEGSYEDKKEFDFKISGKFSGELNGMQSFEYPHSNRHPSSIPLRSELPPPAVAPLNGYESSFDCFVRNSKTMKWSYASSFDENRNWIFRVRTELDENGNIVSANYGWMSRDIILSPVAGNGRLDLRYYYNPNSKSRSLEPKEIADRQNKD